MIFSSLYKWLGMTNVTHLRRFSGLVLTSTSSTGQSLLLSDSAKSFPSSSKARIGWPNIALTSFACVNLDFRSVKKHVKLK